jgi:hypothetical protein
VEFEVDFIVVINLILGCEFTAFSLLKHHPLHRSSSTSRPRYVYIALEDPWTESRAERKQQEK